MVFENLKKDLNDYIVKNKMTILELGEFLGLSYPTVKRILENGDCSSKVYNKIIKKIGYDKDMIQVGRKVKLNLLGGDTTEDVISSVNDEFIETKKGYKLQLSFYKVQWNVI